MVLEERNQLLVLEEGSQLLVLKEGNQLLMLKERSQLMVFEFIKALLIVTIPIVAAEATLQTHSLFLGDHFSCICI